MPQPASAPTAVRIATTLASILLVVALAASGWVLVSIGVGLARDGDSLIYGQTLPAPMQLSTDDVGPLPAGLALDSWMDVDVRVQDPSVRQMVLRSAADIGTLVLAVWTLWLVRAVLRAVLRGEPFGPGNARRLRNLGLLLAVGGNLVELVNYSLRQALYESLPAIDGAEVGVAGFSLPGGYLLAGLAAFVLATVFAYGAELREDVEATI